MIDKRELYVGLTKKGHAEFNSGNLGSAERIFQNTLSIAIGLGDDNLICDAAINLGGILLNLGLLEKAQEMANIGLENSRKNRNRSLESYSYGLIGHLRKASGDFPEAMRYFSKSLKISEELSDIENTLRQLTNIGLLFSIYGYRWIAIDYYRLALKIADKMRHCYWISDCLGNIAKVYLMLNRIDLAESFANDALKANPDELWNLLGHKELIGSILLRKGEVLKAEPIFLELYDYYNNNGLTQSVITTSGFLGKIYIELGNKLKAEHFTQIALVKAQNNGFVNLMQIADNQMSLIKKMDD